MFLTNKNCFVIVAVALQNSSPSIVVSKSALSNVLVIGALDYSFPKDG